MLEGEGDKHAVNSRAYRGVAVQVSDETGRPVAGARVSFRLPESGPSGRFAGGALKEDSFTDSKGRTAAWGIQWNQTPGPCQIVIVAAAGEARAGISVQVTLVAKDVPKAEPPPAPTVTPSFEVPIPRPAIPPRPAPAPAPSPPPAEPAQRRGVVFSRSKEDFQPPPPRRGKWVVLALGAAGAVGGGLAYSLTRQPGKTASPAATGPTLPAPTLTIGQPTITVSRP